MRAAAFRVLVVTGLLGLITALPAHAATHAITMANYAFSPASETISAGDSVTWTNTDQAPHDVTVTSGPVAIHSPTITTGQSWTYTFTTAGTYAYICSIHPDMHATLVVAPVAQAPTQAAAPPPVPARTIAPVRTMTHPAPAQVVAPTAIAPTTIPPAGPTSNQPSTTGQPVAAAQSAPQPTLNPLLLVAGLVAAVATLCLLLLGSRPDSHRD
jgi:plastocyanin